MRFPQGWELIVVLAVILLLFGSKRLPDAARGLGRSLRIFKSEIKTMQDEDPSPQQAPADPADPTDGAGSEPGTSRPQTPPRSDG